MTGLGAALSTLGKSGADVIDTWQKQKLLEQEQARQQAVENQQIAASKASQATSEQNLAEKIAQQKEEEQAGQLLPDIISSIQKAKETTLPIPTNTSDVGPVIPIPLTDEQKTLQSAQENPVLYALQKAGPLANTEKFQKYFGGLQKEQEFQQTAAQSKELKQAALDQAAQLQKDRLQEQTDRANQADETRRLLIGQSKDNKEIALSQKEDQRNQDRLTKLSMQLDPSQLTRGPFSVSKQVLDRADRLRSLDDAVAKYQDNNGDIRQMKEFALGLASEIQGGNIAAQKIVEDLTPKTIQGDWKKILEWVSNNPQGADQQSFAKRMMQSVMNERGTAEQQIKKTRFQRIASYYDLKDKIPDGFNNVLLSNEVDPEEYESWKKSGFKKIEIEPSKNPRYGEEPSKTTQPATWTSKSGASFNF